MYLIFYKFFLELKFKNKCVCLHEVEIEFKILNIMSLGPRPSHDKDHLLAQAKQACELNCITIHSMCKILTRTQSISCGLQKRSHCCREEERVVNKMCSRGRMKVGGQEIHGKNGDWIMRQEEYKVKSEDIFNFIPVF